MFASQSVAYATVTAISLQSPQPFLRAAQPILTSPIHVQGTAEDTVTHHRICGLRGQRQRVPELQPLGRCLD